MIHVLHFKMAMAPINLTWDKNDDMMCKLFETTLCDNV